jgi:hypothetical protein
LTSLSERLDVADELLNVRCVSPDAGLDSGESAHELNTTAAMDTFGSFTLGAGKSVTVANHF